MDDFFKMLANAWYESSYTGIWVFCVLPSVILAATMLAPRLSAIRPRPVLSSLGIALWIYGLAFVGTLLCGPFSIVYFPFMTVMYWLANCLVWTVALYILVRREYACSARTTWDYIALWWGTATIAAVIAVEVSVAAIRLSS